MIKAAWRHCDPTAFTRQNSTCPLFPKTKVDFSKIIERFTCKTRMMEDSLTKEGRTLGRTRTMTYLLQIIINVRLQSKYQPNVFILLKGKKGTYQQTYILLKRLVKKLCKLLYVPFHVNWSYSYRLRIYCVSD